MGRKTGFILLVGLVGVLLIGGAVLVFRLAMIYHYNPRLAGTCGAGSVFGESGLFCVGSPKIGGLM
jgi:hypothetical protein